jgi:hypothetical protein
VDAMQEIGKVIPPSECVAGDGSPISVQQERTDNPGWTDEIERGYVFVPPIIGSFVIACFLVDGPLVVVRSTIALWLFSGAIGTLLVALGSIRIILFSFRFEPRLVEHGSLLAVAWLHGFLVLAAFSLWVAPTQLEMAVLELPAEFWRMKQLMEGR